MSGKRSIAELTRGSGRHFYNITRVFVNEPLSSDKCTPILVSRKLSLKKRWPVALPEVSYIHTFVYSPSLRRQLSKALKTSRSFFPLKFFSYRLNGDECFSFFIQIILTCMTNDLCILSYVCNRINSLSNP